MSSTPDHARTNGLPGSEGGDARRYGTLWRRIFAGLIDILALQLLWGAHRWVSDQHPAVVLFVLWYIVFRTALVAYSVVLHARWGQTIGKRLQRVKLLDAGEQRLPGLRQCLLRDILPVAQLPIFLWLVMPDLLAGHDPGLDSERVLQIVGLRWISTSWILAELATMFVGKNGRSLPDYIAGTVVVRTDTEES